MTTHLLPFDPLHYVHVQTVWGHVPREIEEMIDYLNDNPDDSDMFLKYAGMLYGRSKSGGVSDYRHPKLADMTITLYKKALEIEFQKYKETKDGKHMMKVGFIHHMIATQLKDVGKLEEAEEHLAKAPQALNTAKEKGAVPPLSGPAPSGAVQPATTGREPVTGPVIVTSAGMVPQTAGGP